MLFSCKLCNIPNNLTARSKPPLKGEEGRASAWRRGLRYAESNLKCTKANPHRPLGFPPGEAKGDFTNSPGILRGHNCLPQPLSRCGGSSALHETAVRRRGRLHPLNLSGALFSLPPLGVVLRAANQDSNDCRWQSYLCFVPRSGKGGDVGWLRAVHIYHSTEDTPSATR